MSIVVINGIIGIELEITVKQGEKFKQDLVITDKAGVPIPLPPDFTLTLTKAGTSPVSLAPAGGLSISGNTISFNKMIDFPKGGYDIDASVSGIGFPNFKIYGSFIVI